MADSFIRVPADDVGKRVDTEQLTVSGNVVERERMQIAGDTDTDIAIVVNTDPAASDHGLVTREVGPVSPQISTGTDIAISAGSDGTVDSTQITSSTTGKLAGFVAASTVPIKVQLQTVLNAVATTRGVFINGTREVKWVTPHKEYITQVESATAGFDGFRLLITNLDTSQPADVYGTFFWDEV